MIIRKDHDLFDQHGSGCAHCGKPVVEFPFISWDFQDNGVIARVAFHHECAKKFTLRLARDLYEIDAGN